MTTSRNLMIAPSLALALALAGAAAAQDIDAEPASEPLAGIDRSLRRIVELLEIQVGNQRAELAVQRLDIARRELVARERELHDASAERDAWVRQQDELAARVDTYGSRTQEETGMTPEDYEFMRVQLELEVDAAKQSIWRTDQRIVDLRNEIARVREDLETWEKLVMEAFVPQ